MPRARWGITSADVDNYDRSTQFKPYTGQIPPNGVYEFLIRALKYMPATADKNPQLRLSVALAPRASRPSERRYDDFYVTTFIPVTKKSQFRYVPFLDAIGVSGRDFEGRTVVDGEGNITSIGKWRQDGGQYILCELIDNPSGDERYPKDIKWIGPIPDDEEDPEDSTDEEDDDDSGECIDDEIPF